MDEYWARRCPGCAETGETNLECVTNTAQHLGITVEQAMREFGPRKPEPHCETHWQCATWQNEEAGT